MGRKRICFPSLSLPKAISRLSSPSRNFCAHGLLHILLRSQALPKRQPKPHSPSAMTWDLQTHPMSSHSSHSPEEKDNEWKATFLQGLVALAWVWHKKHSQAPKVFTPTSPIILTQLLGPSTVSSAARLVWNMPLCSFKPVLVGHERRRLGSAAVEKQCAKSTTAVFMRLASVLWLCHE